MGKDRQDPNIGRKNEILQGINPYLFSVLTKRDKADIRQNRIKAIDTNKST